MHRVEQSKQSNGSKGTQQESQNVQMPRFSSKFCQLVPEAKQFSFLVQALPIVSMDKLKVIHLHSQRASKLVVHPATMVSFSRGLNLILARIILNSIFIYDSSSTLRAASRDICAGAEHVFELDTYLSSNTPDYPFMKGLLYDLKCKSMTTEKGTEGGPTTFSESCDIENFKSKLLLHYVSESKQGSCFKSLFLSRYAKNLTAAHIREGQLLSTRLGDIIRSQRAYSQFQIYPHLTSDQRNIHQLSLIPSINWVQITIYNLPYKYELMAYIRRKSIMKFDQDDSLKWYRATQSFLSYDEENTIDPTNTITPMEDCDCIISSDHIESIMYVLVDHWIKMSFFYHVTDFTMYNSHTPQKQQKHATQRFPMYTRPEKIDGISIKRIEDAFLLHYNLSGPREQNIIPYIGENQI